MAHKLRHTILRNGIYVYNRRIPEHAQAAHSCTVARISLGRDKDKAEEVSKALSEKLDLLWASPNPASIQIDKIVESVKPKTLDLLKCMELYLGERDIRSQ